jgi:pyrroloquinoline quinone biosynthesis protein E
VLPDFYRELAKPGTGGRGRTAIVVTPSGDVLPCQAAWGGCRCQALRLAGDAAAADPVCRFSPHHDRVVSARDSEPTADFRCRTMKRAITTTNPTRR